MSMCCLCSNLAAGGLKQKWDEPLFDSNNFLALPSLGSIVEGWMLLVPKKHYLSIGAMPVDLVHEMMDFKAYVAAQLMRKYGTLCAFEHGPSSLERQVGCGVDHAHIHIVPVGFDLILAAQPYLPKDIRWTHGDLYECRSAFARGDDYLYVEQPIGKGHIAVHAKFGSQIFRKAIASQLGVPGRYNWREYPNHEKISQTIENIKADCPS